MGLRPYCFTRLAAAHGRYVVLAPGKRHITKVCERWLGLAKLFEAPGRVNLIGEHTDYTGGFVLPMAIPFTTTATLEPASDDSYRFGSANFTNARVLTPHEPFAAMGDWSDYPVGVLQQLQMRGVKLPPFELTLSGDVPLGAGLSSSASVEVVTAIALLAHAGMELPEAEIATLCRAAENDFVGSPCGIMDQFVVTAAKAGNALLLNTGDLTYELLPMNTGPLAACRVVVVNSMIKHSIAGGDYGKRREEVEAGQRSLHAMFPALRSLSQATPEQLKTAQGSMSPASYKRCRHIITENSRVLEARTAMLAGDAPALGAVMTRAHASERDDFECSTAEIDFMVEKAVSIPGCFGARLTGGGFGGCTVNLVHESAVERFGHILQAAYHQRFSVESELYVCEAVDGALQRLNPQRGKELTA